MKSNFEGEEARKFTVFVHPERVKTLYEYSIFESEHLLYPNPNTQNQISDMYMR
jgi:hypothetical protein